ncbi:hypothetical protein [Streptococcus vulneris]|uniref:DUF669 domain-containing protein n=1 Tax=Streptococcus vulneris TaxID=2853160 RepID=A0ABS6SW44_9STRE|nr:hypothetical protein [Streptococcus vulneris]MBV7365937.1 hypothetical protein [Streptococcus vulneris]
MSLLDIAKQLKANGYDPRKDKVNNGNQHLPGGEYPVVLTGVEARIAESKWESINYAFEVRDPESPFNGRTQYVGMGTLDTWKKDGKTMDLTNLVETTVKFFQKALELADDKMKASDLEDNKSMEDALKRKAVGTKFVLVIGEFTKRDKSTGYNYDLEEYQFGKTESVPEIDDDDLPF